jgi:trk system potassium uptake protein TrkH
MQQLLSIAHVLGGLLMVFSVTYLMPVVWSLAVSDGTHRSFILSGAATLVVGALLFGATRRHRRELHSRDGALLVVLGWGLMAAVATVPLMLEIEGLSFTDAFFETMSGLTTTGATVLTGLDHLPQAVNLWRHALNWYGGMGIIVLAVAILPILGVGGMQLYKAETPGPIKESKLTPRITQTAKYLWLLYAGLTALCILSLKSLGMTWHEAVCHAFSSMALGGFSTRDASIAGFDSPAIEAVLMLFMMIAVLNFSTHFVALRQRSLQVYVRDQEVFAVWSLIAGSALMLACFLYWKGTYPDFLLALRHAAFNTVSIATSSGFMSDDFDQWPIFAPMWMLLLCTIASSAGSTGGGIKMIRVLILLRLAGNELIRMVHPRAVTPLCLSGQVVDNKVILAVMGYMLLWGLTLVVLSFLMMATGLDLTSAVSGVLACLNNTGPGLNELGPARNYQVLTDFQTWLCSFAMMAGRLELLTVFVLFMPAFWRK